MDVTTGKHTRWPLVRLGDVCEFERGLTYSKTDEVEFSTNVVLRANNVDLITNQLIFDELRYISDKVYVPPTKKIKKDSLIICTASGSKSHLGKVAYIDDDYNFAFGGFMGLLIPLKIIHPKYFFYMMISPEYKSFIDSLSNGSNINNLKYSDLQMFQLPLPPLAEQQRIVARLDAAFAAIAEASAAAESNLRNARALFDSYLDQVFSTRGAGWVERRLGDVALEFGRGKSKHRPRNAPELFGGNYPFIQTGDVRNSSRFITEFTQTYNEKGLRQSKLWPKGTICITIAANIAETAVLDFDACFPDSIIGLVVDPQKAHNSFVVHMLQHHKKYLQSLSKGSAQANINLGTFEDEWFYFPTINEQVQIDKQLTLVQLECESMNESYQQKIAALAELKQSLLAEVFGVGE